MFSTTWYTWCFQNPLYTDCVAPIRGQYLTFQHYVATDLVEVSEVDVTVFCGDQPLIEEKTMCQAVTVDACGNAALKTQS